MNRVLRSAATFVATGLLAGLVLAMLGVPYGRWNPEVLAELYHGEVDTSGTFHMALDCDVFSPGTQSHCVVFAPGGIDIAVTIGNSTGAAANIDAFNFRVTNNRQDLLDPAIGIDADLNSNPDFNDAVAPIGWLCTPPPPDRDEDLSNTIVSVSFLSCYDDQSPPSGFDPIPVPAGFDHVKLATVHYNGVGPTSGEYVATFTLSDVNVFDTTGTQIELMSCNPVNQTAGPCFGATVTLIGPHDPDGDNVPTASDNCQFTYNPDQTNTDRNFISNAPEYVVNDTTRANSDNLGDACDSDDDNDGRLSDDEVFGTISCISTTVIYYSDYLVADTDGDRVLDGAECQFATDPMDANSKPLPATCGSTTDVDLDGLTERLERCHYNTSPTVADTDGDGVKDGCEAASLNGDAIVNSGDQGLLASEIMRMVPASAKLVNFDLTKDGSFNSGDQGLMASRIGKCP
jgi:hypothetical protein